jgi:hypothetical protein
VEEGRNVLTTDDIETVNVADLNKGNESRSDATEKCPVCHGTEGKHFPHCPKQPISDERNPAEGNNELPPPALEQNEVGEMLPGKLDPHSKPLSEDEVQAHFDTADELFEGKKFEDGAVVQTPEEQLSSVKLPPSAQMLVGNELLWLIARTCHEVNRAYCVGVMSDHSHQPWDQSPDWQRESCYEGVLKHYHNPSFTPEDSHKSWMAKKTEEGWVFGNLKDETAKTHPCLVPYHTLHIHDRTKDAIFSAICKSMLGGAR